MSGLDINDLIPTSINLTPAGAQAPNLASTLIIGDSNIINTRERVRDYSDLLEVADDFGTDAPEYAGAVIFFGQTPTPILLNIGRWAKTATSGLLLGGPLSAAQQAIGNWNTIANGSFRIQVDGGAATNITGIDFETGPVTNLNGVASAITAALTTAEIGAVCTWNGSQFQFTSSTTGTSSKVIPLTTATADVGTDISAQLLCTAATDTYEVDGIAAESAISCVTLIDATIPISWFGLNFAAGANNADIADSDHEAIAAYVEGLGGRHLYGLTTAEAAAITSVDDTSIGYELHQLGYNWTFYEYSTQNAFASCGIFGIGVGVNWNGSNTAINFMWKQIAGVAPEPLTETGSSALNANCYNYQATYSNNNTVAGTILVNGFVASGSFVDTVWGIAWLKGQIQTNMFNALLDAPKIPQTDAGMQTLAASAALACSQGVANGFLAPGTWTAGGFGQLSTGDFVPKGYYIYVPPVASQEPSARSARQAVAFQVGAKCAGAVNRASVLIDVNP